LYVCTYHHFIIWERLRCADEPSHGKDTKIVLLAPISLALLAAARLCPHPVLSEVLMRQTCAHFAGMASRNMFVNTFGGLTVRVSIAILSYIRSYIIRLGPAISWSDYREFRRGQIMCFTCVHCLNFIAFHAYRLLIETIGSDAEGHGVHLSIEIGALRR